VTLLEPVVVPLLAEIVVLPSEFVLRRLQVSSPVVDTVATDVELELHVTRLVIFRGAPME